MGQPLSTIRKRHSPDEMEAKLRQAEKMVAEGKRQADIAKALDISVMTYHRWRKRPPDVIRYAAQGAARTILPERDEEKGLAQLQTENARLRRLMTDLLLEKIELEEALRAQSFRRRRPK